MVTPDYDPDVGKVREYQHDWHRYFFRDGVRECEPTEIHFADRGLGIESREYPLKKGSLDHFTLAALSPAFPYSTYRRFFHQSNRMKVRRLALRASAVGS
jgi:hypothetical protein